MSLEPWKAQRIGNLRERITITGDAEIIGYNTFNEPIYGDPVEMTVAARVEPIKGGEVIAAGQVSGYHEVTFHTRYIENASTAWSIEHRGSTYDITAFRNVDERRRFLAIEAKAAA